MQSMKMKKFAYFVSKFDEKSLAFSCGFLLMLKSDVLVAFSTSSSRKFDEIEVVFLEKGYLRKIQKSQKTQWKGNRKWWENRKWRKRKWKKENTKGRKEMVKKKNLKFFAHNHSTIHFQSLILKFHRIHFYTHDKPRFSWYFCSKTSIFSIFMQKSFTLQLYRSPELIQPYFPPDLHIYRPSYLLRGI